MTLVQGMALAEICLAQVIWRLDSGAKTFLPRLQGALTAINPAPSDAACYVVTQADNTIRLVGTSLPPCVVCITLLQPLNRRLHSPSMHPLHHSLLVML